MTDWVDRLADAGSVTTPDGSDESVLVRRAAIGGHDVVLVASDFSVSAGTLGRASARRFSQGVDVALAERRALVCVATSGGTRMGEGTAAFVQMVVLAAAVRKVRRAGLPVIVHVAHPTTGGVLASWGSLGHVTFAEPGATVAFTGPRVGTALGEPFDDLAAHTSEGFFDSGLVDAVVPDDDLRAAITGALDALVGEPHGAPGSPDQPTTPPVREDAPRGWAAVTSSRAPDRPDVFSELLSGATSIVRLQGDRVGGRDDATWAGIVRLHGRSVAMIGTLRDGTAAGRPSAAGLRTARRVLGIAEELGLAVVTIIDTSGAVIGSESERSGISGEIARSIDAWTAASVPTMSVLAGSGCGGGALAWLAADRIIAADDGWLAPIAPEAASLIVHRDTDHAAELADAQGVDATTLAAAGVVDAVHPVSVLATAVSVEVGGLIATNPTVRARRFAHLAPTGGS